jgi:excinuclease ABC subunit B
MPMTPLEFTFGDEIEEIESFDVKTAQVIEKFEKPAHLSSQHMFVTSPDVLPQYMGIQQDLVKQVDNFKEIGTS